MAVYTHLGAEDLARLIAAFDVGDLVAAKGIAEGVSNSNWLIETSGAPAGANGTSGTRFILTMYERRIDTDELPFFLGLLDHLAARGCPVPRTIHDRVGHGWRDVDGKAVALIEYLPGVSPDRPTAAQANAVGAALAGVHLASRDFPLERANGLGVAACRDILAGCGASALATIDAALPAMLPLADDLVTRWPTDLPQSTIHSDLFPDNVLMLGDRVTGMIDFYFACTGAMAYDLAVTHAAWCFDKRGERFDPALGRALIAGYESIRPLEPEERAQLPLLAQGACLRFTASRAEDWLETPGDAHVTRKDPMDFVRRWHVYGENGAGVFA